MVMYAKIRRMFYREHLSINEIQRRTSLSRNTIKKWLKAPSDSAVKYQRAKKPGKLTPFESRLLLALESDARRPRKDRRTVKMLFQEIRKDGYAGGYTIVCDFVRNWRNQGGQSKTAYVPLKFALGEAFQFDWSEEWLVIGGIHRRVLAAHTKLCASRAFMLSGYPSQSHEMLFDAHTRAFTAFGGIPKRGIYDNMKTAVDKVSKGNGRVVNTRFFAMTAHYLFDPDFCNVASGWEKGVVEKNVQDMRRHIWSEAKQQQFGSMAAVHQYADRIEVVHDNAVVACHRRLLDSDRVSYDWQHYIPVIEKKPGVLRNGAPFAELPAPLLKLQTALRRRERQQADRIMAKVLSLVPTHGLEAVLVAAELVLESGAPSAEHVSNVLARLKQTDSPAQVETTLKLKEEPQADTARYDRLHTKEVPHV
jgi:transposase